MLNRKVILRLLALPALLLASAVNSETPTDTEPQAGAITYDIVITGGRVMDPETKLDAIRNVGIADGKIAAITTQSLQGERMIDAAGQIVAPGFIDIHNHSPTPLGLAYQAQDGVTTTLDLEAGAFPINDFGRLIRGQAPINYGASAGFAAARLSVMTDYSRSHGIEPPRKIGDEGKPISRVFTDQANPEELAELKAAITEALEDGAIGIGVPLDYVSAAVKQAELDMLFALAAEYNAPLFIHIRRGLAGDPAGLDEAIAMARKHGTRTLICHLSHSAIQNTAMFLDKIRTARSEGVDIHAEVLPYNAGSVFIGAAAFQRDWKRIFNIDYGDVQLASTGERFTKESFERTQRDNPQADIIHHYLKEEWTRLLVAAPDVIISSDGLVARSTDEKIPPQGVGSFSKVLGTYVRDEAALDMMTALSKMTLQPALLLEKAAPIFRLKGRLQISMDADITVFEPATISGNSTYADPHQASTGVSYLMVDGQIVIEEGALLPDIFPGQFLKASPRRRIDLSE